MFVDPLGNGLAHADDPRFQRLVDQAEAVARLDIAERQAQHAPAVFFAERRNPAFLATLDEHPEIRQLVGGDEAELLEKGVAGRQVGKDLDHGPGNRHAHLEQDVTKPFLLEQIDQQLVLGEVGGLVRLLDRRPEQEIFRDRGVQVVALGVETDDEIDRAFGLQARAQGLACLQNVLGHPRLFARVDGPAQAEAIDVILHFHQFQDLGQPAGQIAGALEAGGSVIDPVGVEIERRVAGVLAFRRLPRLFRRRVAVELGGDQGPVLEAVDEVFVNGMGKQIGVRPDVGDPAAGDRRGLLGNIPRADLDVARRGSHESGQQHAQVLLAAAAVADDRDMVGELPGEARRVDQPGIRIVGQRHRRDVPVSAQRLGLRCLGVLHPWLDHVRRLELLDHLVVFDLYVVTLLVPVDQLLDRAGQILIGGDHRHQGADIQLALYRQDAAQGIEDEGRELGQQVVEKLDEELALKDLVADVEDPAQASGEVGPFVVAGVVGMDLDGAVDDLAHPAGQLPRGQLPFAPEHQDALPELGDQEGLQQHDRGRDKPQPNALQYDEGHGRNGLATEEDRRDEGVADEAAQRLDLVLDHGRHFRLLDLAQVENGKAQDPVDQLVTQPSQHAFAQAALAGVDDEFETAVHQDQRQEGETDCQQQILLLQLEAAEQLDLFARE